MPLSAGTRLGRTFLMIKDPSTAAQNTARRGMIVVVNWFDELQQRMAAAR